MGRREADRESQMTANMRKALEVLESEPRRGFDLAELARRLETSREGAAKTCSALVRHGLAVRFVGGVVPQRVHYQAARGTVST